MSDRGTPWKELSREWSEQAGENVEKWGKQDVDTLLLAAQEELGELTQAHLEANAEGGERYRMYAELKDLAALLYQIQWALEWEEMNE